MNNKLTKTKNPNLYKSGYAILFAVVIVSIISMLAVGLSNSAYKQIILSSLAKDSQSAFYQSDTATECGLYAENILALTSGSPSPWECGIDSDGDNNTFTIGPLDGGGDGYQIDPTSLGSSTPCFEISVEKGLLSPTSVSIKGRGYNSCDKTNTKTVQREIEVNY